MATSFLKHTKYPFFPLWGGVTCVFKCVDKIIYNLLVVAITISKLYLSLQIVSFIFTNKALVVVANLFKAFKPTLLRGFFYTRNLITC